MTKEEVLIEAKDMLYQLLVYNNGENLSLSVRQKIVGVMDNIKAVLKDFEVEDRNKILVDCLKGAMNEYDLRLQEAYKKAGGIFSSIGPDWYNQAYDFFHARLKQKP